MNTEEEKQRMEQLQADLKKFKDESPDQYLELLKTLNHGMAEIAADLEKITQH